MQLIWTESALEDAQNIKQFISRNSPIYAEYYIDRLIQEVEKLRGFPKMGRIVPEMSSNDLRELIFDNYRIIYLVEKKKVVVVKVIHGRRNLNI